MRRIVVTGALMASVIGPVILLTGAASATPPVGTGSVFGNAGGLYEPAAGPGDTQTLAARATDRFHLVDSNQGVTRDSVGSAILLVTVQNPAAAGHLVVWTGGGNRPATSNVNFAAHQTVADRVIVPLANDGSVTVYNASDGATAINALLTGYTRAGPAEQAGAYRSIGPARLMDTRQAGGGVAPAGRGTTSLRVLGRGGVPTTGVAAVAVTLTAVGPASSSGYLTAYRGGSPRPTTSNVNFPRGGTASDLAVVPVGSDGAVTIFNGATATTQVVVDVSGFYLGGTATAEGAVHAVTPTRLVDTRVDGGALRGGENRLVPFTGQGGVPSNATRLLVVVTATGATADGTLSTTYDGYPPDLPYARASTVAVSAVAVVSSTAHGIYVHNDSTGTTNAVVDVVGYVGRATSTSTMSGVVTDARTGRPVSGVPLSVLYHVPQDDDVLFDVAVTAADGSWSVSVPRDSTTDNRDDYFVCFRPSDGGGTTGYADQCFHTDPDVDQTLIQVVIGQARTGIDAALQPSGCQQRRAKAC